MLIFPVEKSSESSDFEKSSLKSCYFYESDSDYSDSDDSDFDDSDFDESTGNDWPDPVFLSDQSDPLIPPNQSESLIRAFSRLKSQENHLLRPLPLSKMHFAGNASLC